MRYSELKIVEQRQTLTESTTRVSVGNRTYEVGNDYIREGNSYKIFSGDSARQYAEANNLIVPPKAVIQAIESQGRMLEMPTRNNNPTDRNAQAHTQQIFQANGLNGFPSGLVYGHKKEIVQGAGGTRLYGGNVPSIQPYPLQSGNSDQHGGGYSDYSQAMRTCREVGTGGSSAGSTTTTASTRGQAPEQTGELRAGPPYPREQMAAVRDMQEKLDDLGYSVGTTGADGKYGPRTTNAVRAFKRDFDIDGDGLSMDASALERLASAEPVDNPTPTGNEASGRGGDDQIEFERGTGSGRVRQEQSRRARTRRGPLDDRLVRVLERAAEEAGVDVIVFSGGQPRRDSGSTDRVGSIRHDEGLAADVWIYSNGRRLSTATENPIVSRFIAACVANGARGIGAGPGYMDSVGIHVDLWGDRAGSNTWGRGNRSANTPEYVAQAYRAGQSGSLA